MAGGQQIREMIKKIGFGKLLLIGLAGIVLVICSMNNEENAGLSEHTMNAANTSDSEPEIEQLTEELEAKLEQFLVQVDGVGKVDVMIVLRSGEGEEILKDTSNTKDEVTESDSQGGSRDSLNYSSSEQTITKENGSPYVLKKLAPEIAGIAIVAEGGGDATVHAALTELTASLFAIDVTQISVSKMK
ncbi:MAG: hypothetical protein E7269_03600 [Lachnospiraceae bacterium]|nr:hypothetical protein [Lachnospiraceae bacterium]